MSLHSTCEQPHARRVNANCCHCNGCVVGATRTIPSNLVIIWSYYLLILLLLLQRLWYEWKLLLINLPTLAFLLDMLGY